MIRVFSKQTPLMKLVEEGELMSYVHTGFGSAWITSVKKTTLGFLANGTAPWKK